MTPEQRKFQGEYNRMLLGVRLFAPDGTEVPMTNEFENVNGPGWLHYNRGDRNGSVQLLRNGVNYLSLLGFMEAEVLRARRLAASMSRAGVARIEYATPEIREFFTFSEEAKRLLDEAVRAGM